METDRYRLLREAVDKVSLVDAHAHNLVSLQSSLSFLRCFSEAEGDALADVHHTLSFKRSLRDISALYQCETSLSEVEKCRRIQGLHSSASMCFSAANISVVLIDDGIQFNEMHEVEWHQQFVPAVGRIQRIEHLAEKILLDGAPSGANWTLDLFTVEFVKQLTIVSRNVVALKSIAAYRSGLKIDTRVSKENAERGLVEVLGAGKPVHICNKHLIDYIFTQSLEIAMSFDLPIQIHTGFGDKDLDLRLSNPLYLRAVLEDERFSGCRIVLLHASYPFSKEASYLASVYSQVYLDIGLAVPKLSILGMISSVKDLLNLASTKKVMFSTDGYAFAETFYLGARRAREVVFSVLHDACDEGDLTVSEAVEAVDDILRGNAIRLYKLSDMPGFLFCKSSPQSWNAPSDSDLQQGNIFVRITWVDASGKHRCRAVPTKRFFQDVTPNGIGLAFACMGMTSTSDGPADGTDLTAVGEIRLIPDLSTKRILPWKPDEAMVLADMHLVPGVTWEYCPREALRKVSKILKDEFCLEMKAGFEIEFYLLKNLLSDTTSGWIPYDLTSYCSTSSFDSASLMLKDLFIALEAMGIVLQQVHAESGKGQFEVAIGHTSCIQAADNLVFAKEAIKSISRKHGLLATFVPKFFLNDIGSGCHVHISLSSGERNVFMSPYGQETQYGMSKVGENFMAGVLLHLSAIMAFTAPLPNSYDRIQPNTWSGAYHCWGKENREAPLRTACPPGVPPGFVSNFEIKCFDGCANPYLGLASILAAGLDGLRKVLMLPNPIDKNPSFYHGKLERLPEKLEESVEALCEDNVLKDLIGQKLVKAVIGVRKAEIKQFTENKGAYKQLINDY